MDASEILNILKEDLKEGEYKNYITHLKFNKKQSKADSLIFSAPNGFLTRFIRTKYAGKIAYIYGVQSGNKAKISVQSQTYKSKNSTKIDIAHIKMQSMILNPSFTFDNFVVGGSNQYAYATCKAVSQKDKLGKLYNPIFIYGPTGLGKTHLLQAAGNAYLEVGKKVIYATSENFINDFNSHIINKTMDKFQEKYQNCDVLLIDDIQFLGKVDKIQEKFFFISNEIRDQLGQIVITSDNPPNMLKGITDRPKSRFANGIIADITPPQLETEIAIIHKKYGFNEVNLSNETINYLATAMEDNIREIESMIINLNAHSRLINQEISLELAKEMMKDHIREEKESITIEDILSIVSKESSLKTSDIKSTKRTQSIVPARRIIVFLARELTNLSMPQLTMHFEMKNHTAISYNIKKINEMIEENHHLKSKIEELRSKVLIKSQS